MKFFEKNFEGAIFSERDFRETLDGGQSFRWIEVKSPSPAYEGIFGRNFARLELLKDGSVRLSANAEDSNSFRKIAEETRKYLDLDRDYSKLKEFLSKKSKGDRILLSAFREHPNLRILRQSPAEAIECFICSSSKRIVQIKQCVELIAKNLGDEIENGKFSLPTFERIADADPKILRSCKLGFRADYLKKTAKKIVEDKFEPDSLREIPYEEAKKYLTSLSGIGEKVADCILLFGASRFEAFPVDTWIKKAMSELYGTGENPSKIREFAREKFGEYSGYAQQVIFAAKRKGLI